ncbi:MAG: hypothetical protein AAF564_18530 [Bacteroidota bacterium]
MSSMLYIYLDPGSPTLEFELDCLDAYGFAMSNTTQAVVGSNAIGELIFEKLDEQAQALLQVKGRAFEAHLKLRAPEPLKQALMAYHKAAAQVFEDEQERARALIEKADAIIPGHETLLFFKYLQRDIGGAVLICDLAIEAGKDVYWAIA